MVSNFMQIMHMKHAQNGYFKKSHDELSLTDQTNELTTGTMTGPAELTFWLLRVT